MGIYKIEKEKRVRVKVRKGPWTMVRYKDGGPHAWQWQALLLLLLFFFLAAVFFAGNNERNELEYNNSKTCVSD